MSNFYPSVPSPITTLKWNPVVVYPTVSSIDEQRTTHDLPEVAWDKSSKVKIALCMIWRDAEDYLRRWDFIDAFANEIVILDTGSRDSTRLWLNKKKLLGDKLKVVKYDWVDDFADARNVALSHVSNDVDWWYWLDADDVVQLRHLDDFIASLSSVPDYVTSISVPYEYAYDAQDNVTILQHRERFFRRNTHVEWKRRIHEVAVSDGMRLSVADLLARGIPVSNLVIKHKPMPDSREPNRNARINLAIWNNAQKTGETLDDVTLMYIQRDCMQSSGADLCYGVGKQLLSRPIQNDFVLAEAVCNTVDAGLALSRKYATLALDATELVELARKGLRGLVNDSLTISRLRIINKLCDVYEAIQQPSELIDLAGFVCSELPNRDVGEAEVIWLVDITEQWYWLARIAKVSNSVSDTLDALKAYYIKHPKGQHPTIETLLSSVSISTGVPDNYRSYSIIDQLEPAEVQIHSHVTFVAPGLEDWSSLTPYMRGIGASESALTELACRCESADIYHTHAKSVVVERVHYYPLTHYRLNMPFETLVVSRLPYLVHGNGSKNVIFWAHDVPENYNLSPAHMKICKAVVAVSEWQKEQLMQYLPNKEIVVIPNMRPTRVTAGHCAGSHGYYLWASQFERGLENLLDAMILNIDLLGGMPLKVLGDFRNLLASGNTTFVNRLSVKIELVNQIKAGSVVMLGKRSIQDTRDHMRNAAELLYCCNFKETQCMTVVEAAMVGCPVRVVRYTYDDCGALDETLDKYVPEYKVIETAKGFEPYMFSDKIEVNMDASLYPSNNEIAAMWRDLIDA